MFNCMCHIDWAKGSPKRWWKIISGCVPEGVSGGDQHLIQQTEWRDSPSPTWAVIIQSTEGPNGTKRWRKGQFSFSPFLSWDVHLFLPSEFGVPSSCTFRLQALHHHLPWFTGLCELNYNSDFSASPACRQQITGFLGLHNTVSQFL